MGQVATIPQNKAVTLEQVLIKGDLATLPEQGRIQYYHEVCKSVGLNPLTQPFAYITLNGKLTLYALRACTDQLRSIHGVSVDDLTETERDGVFIVTAKVRNKDGRTDISKGAVNITGLKGEALANALMKAETKAKRRATLSICGLGMLDETEVDTIPGARASTPAPESSASVIAPAKVEVPAHDPETGETGPRALPYNGKPVEWGATLIAAIKASQSIEEVRAWMSANAETLNDLQTNAPKAYASIDKAAHRRNNELAASVPPAAEQSNDLPF